MQKLLGSAAAAHVSSAQFATITGKRFFPNLISGPFMKGLRITLWASLAMMLIAAWASWMRGAKYVHDDTAGAPTNGTTPHEQDTVGAFGAPNGHGPGTDDQAPGTEEWVPA